MFSFGSDSPGGTSQREERSGGSTKKREHQGLVVSPVDGSHGELMDPSAMVLCTPSLEGPGFNVSGEYVAPSGPMAIPDPKNRRSQARKTKSDYRGGGGSRAAATAQDVQESQWKRRGERIERAHSWRNSVTKSMAEIPSTASEDEVEELSLGPEDFGRLDASAFRKEPLSSRDSSNALPTDSGRRTRTEVEGGADGAPVSRRGPNSHKVSSPTAVERPHGTRRPAGSWRQRGTDRPEESNPGPHSLLRPIARPLSPPEAQPPPRQQQSPGGDRGPGEGQSSPDFQESMPPSSATLLDSDEGPRGHAPPQHKITNSDSWKIMSPKATEAAKQVASRAGRFGLVIGVEEGDWDHDAYGHHIAMPSVSSREKRIERAKKWQEARGGGDEHKLRTGAMPQRRHTRRSSRSREEAGSRGGEVAQSHDGRPRSRDRRASPPSSSAKGRPPHEGRRGGVRAG
ncbi:unnamed protein product, partial [Discosporangium mesarthrocarpum]